ncbi:MAG: Radical protein [Acidobacteriota bacterium]|nr:Radical protein [Acidobacteriota bacterium]
MKQTRIFDIEVSRNCNLSCAFCPREAMGKHGFMEPATFENFLKNAGLQSDDIVIFCGLGESLLNKSFPGYLARLRELQPRIAIQLVTNGTLLKSQTVTPLLDSRINCIMVSFNGVDAPTYETLMKGARFADTIANLDYTLEEIRKRENSRTRLMVTFILAKENLHEEEKINEFWKSKGIGTSPQYMHNRGGFVDMETMSPPESNEPPGRPCTYFEEYHFIAWNGDVMFCCHDIQHKYLLGNINKDSMRVIQSRKKRFIKENKWPDICQTCPAPGLPNPGN